MAYAQAKQALHDRHGNLDIDIAMYLDKKDYGYEVHYVDVPVFDGAKYKGETDKLGIPVNQDEYQAWVSKLPKVKQLNPFHTHRLHFDPSLVTEDKIKASMDFHLPNFFEAWKSGKTIRSGWDTNTRTRPTRYEKLETPQAFDVRQSLVLQRVSEFAVVSKSVTLTGGRTFPATTIDVGSAATDRGTYLGATYTAIDKANPANATGTLDTVEVWAYATITGSKIGTFSGSGTDYDDRDYASVGSIASGSKQTITGLSIDVTSGDFIGIYMPATCYIEAGTEAGAVAVYRKAGDYFGTGVNTYALLNGYAISIYATGDTPASVTHFLCSLGVGT